MTIKEISKQLYNMSIGGWFNHQKFTYDQFSSYLEKMMLGTESGENHTIFLEIALQDGWWNFSVSYIPSCETYGFYIPETREQESKLLEEFNQMIHNNRSKAGFKE